MNANDQIALIAGETLLTKQEIRDWFSSHYPPEVAWKIDMNIADMIGQITQEIFEAAQRPQKGE